MGLSPTDRQTALIFCPCSLSVACLPIDSESNFPQLHFGKNYVGSIITMGVLSFYSSVKSIDLIGTCLKILPYPTYVDIRSRTQDDIYGA
jgi:hypothetical protein